MGGSALFVVASLGKISQSTGLYPAQQDEESMDVELLSTVGVKHIGEMQPLPDRYLGLTDEEMAVINYVAGYPEGQPANAKPDEEVGETSQTGETP